jgi:prepilin-type N-terminal cleavage/methylation domain-containing protein
MTNNQRGFTLTELMISLAFISFLLLFLLTGVVQMTRTYNKGVSIRQINQSGRQFTEDFQRTARYARVSDVKWDPTNQRLCINGVTYAWNLGDPTAVPLASLKNRYSSAGPVITMVRTKDPGGAYCFNASATIIPRDERTTEVLPTTLNVQRLDFLAPALPDPSIVKLSTVFSTGGGNAPSYVGPPSAVSTGYACPGGGAGAFCALADFDATVYMRN